MKIQDDMIPITIDAALTKMDKKAMRELGITKETLVAQMRSIYSSPDVVASMCLDDVAPLLYYHGGRFDMNEEYVLEEEFDNLFGGASAVGNTSLWVDTEESDSTFVVMRTYTKIENETLLPMLKNATIESVKATLTDEEQIRLTIEALEESFKETSTELEQYTTTLIHLPSGWTVAWYFDRDVVVKDATGEAHTKENRQVVLRDEDE